MYLNTVWLYYIVRLYNGNIVIILSIGAIHYTFYKTLFLMILMVINYLVLL
nr:MAG TPA: hypothetical protein [Bacteriophage sp.]